MWVAAATLSLTFSAHWRERFETEAHGVRYKVIFPRHFFSPSVFLLYLRGQQNANNIVYPFICTAKIMF